MASLHCSQDLICCSGDWTLGALEHRSVRLPADFAPGPALRLDGTDIEHLDTSGALQLLNIIAELEQRGVTLKSSAFRAEHQALLDLIAERLHSAGTVTPPASLHPLEQLGREVVRKLWHAAAFLSFIGEVVLSLLRVLVHPWQLRWRALLSDIESAGVHALPIVALLAFMMGVVIAYQGGQQLKTYGANIFIVELVALTMLRELAPLITAIIVAGRTGSAYTAQIGTMQVTEEIDALRTIGIRPIDLLVLPKLLGLVIVLPLLTVFADILSVFGGMVMAQTLLDVSFSDFLDRFPQVVTATSFLLGIGKAPVFAAIIALVGCYQGFQVRGGADSVGRHTTMSVVQAIFLVIAADALFSVALGSVGLWR